MLRFDSKNSGTKLPRHMRLIFSVDIRWKAFAAKKTVTLFAESVKNTQLSGAEGSDVAEGFSSSSPVSLSNIAIVCCRACRSHPIIFISASFDPSSVRLGHRTVYSARREADFVMLSLIWKRFNLRFIRISANCLFGCSLASLQEAGLARTWQDLRFLFPLHMI